MKLRAAKTSAFLSLLFLVVYGASNWLASLRHGVRSIYFPWERHIPFVAWMIVPYMSIDLFFISSPFLCQTDLDRRTLARRITAAILIAGIFFLLFPLRFAFQRPHVDGWLGVIFNNFRTMDQPFNQFPSLHIALCWILADFYARRFNGLLRWLLLIWFALIAISAVVTYQHHLIDVVGGAALALLCFHLFQDTPLRKPTSGNRRVGVYYLIGSSLLIIAAISASPWTWPLFWPAVSLLLIWAAYFGLGAGVFRKTRGRLPLTTRLILWPALLGHRASLAWYARQCNPWDRLTDRLWIGRILSNQQARRAVADGVIAVLDLTAEFSEAPAFLNLHYHQLPLLDLTAPTPEQLDEALAWIDLHIHSGVVYIHCKAGYSRTGAVAGAYLLRHGIASSPIDAIHKLRSARPSIILRPEAIAVLQTLQSRSPRQEPALTGCR